MYREYMEVRIARTPDTVPEEPPEGGNGETEEESRMKILGESVIQWNQSKQESKVKMGAGRIYCVQNKYGFL